MAARVAVVYYSRTGITERVVRGLVESLGSSGVSVDDYRVLPMEEYSRPLHLNPRLVYDTLARRGIDIRFEPGEPKLEEYGVVVVASPVWFNTLAPPIQEFLRRYCREVRSLVAIATSALNVGDSRVCGVVEEICGCRPTLCVNVKSTEVRDPARLERVSRRVSEVVVDLAKRAGLRTSEATW